MLQQQQSKRDDVIPDGDVAGGRIIRRGPKWFSNSRTNATISFLMGMLQVPGPPGGGNCFSNSRANAMMSFFMGMLQVAGSSGGGQCAGSEA